MSWKKYKIDAYEDPVVASRSLQLRKYSQALWDANRQYLEVDREP